MAGGSGVRIPAGPRFLFLVGKVHRVWGPTSLIFSSYRNSFLRLKRTWRGINHSPPSNTEIKNEWSYASISPTCCMVLARIYPAISSHFSGILVFHDTTKSLQFSAHFVFAFK